MDGPHFTALKRRFYFEHQAGPEILDLDGAPGNYLLKVLRADRAPEAAFKQFLIEYVSRLSSCITQTRAASTGARPSSACWSTRALRAARAGRVIAGIM